VPLRSARASELALSVVVPAYNEEKLLAATLSGIRDAVEGAGLAPRRWELRVADNASTDATPDIAAHAGAVVVNEPWRQIARARNAGAREARGRWLLFVDADTRPSRELLAATWALMQRARCCGGGAVVSGHGAGPGARAIIGAWNTLSRVLSLACGAYLFCRADAFRELGGFSEELYAAEELDLSWRLRRWGRARGLDFEVIRTPALHTSLRKLELYSPAELLGMSVRGLLQPRKVLRDRRLLDHWYDGRR
jgi:glycosyltransferase involved in cell wall biosynthesis